VYRAHLSSRMAIVQQTVGCIFGKLLQKQWARTKPTLKQSHSPSAGDDCPFAHGVYEVLLHPLRYRTELCKDFVQRGFCARDVCFFAHFPSEQRTPDEETMVRYNVLQASRRRRA